MLTLESAASFAQEIRRSRFLAHAAPVADEGVAKAFVDARSDRDATHNCWAWRIGPRYRFSDDGEPSGTAGKPILQAIDGQDLDGTAVVVTRWFGGILLGGGGLVRAYGGTAAACLRAARKRVVTPTRAALVDCPFADLALLKARLAGIPGLAVEAETFGPAGAVLTLALPMAEADEIVRRIADLTGGRATVSLPD
ncbi:IMPACT family protein [Aureimonas pseudogalii]|uniref:Putative YigZ family protein n=1 Tax=Aureimonas pseudogalii TaxID=1744844 RepID=A0A7W6H6A0_9HYPH|nr:YigZ family protein [Aureimonas pseudogalii]MBB3999367.1 putative YigZ family protein [Aureimonas pseudogalii]